MVSFWIYHLLLVTAVWGALHIVARNLRLSDCLAMTGLVAFLAAFLAVVLGGNLFGAMRLFSYGLFGYGGILLVGEAILIRKRSRTFSISALLCASLLSVVAVDAFLIEPTWLEVTHISLSSDKLKAPLRVVVIADLQTDQIGAYERDVLRQALAEKPDILVMAGDYLQVHNRKASDRLINELRSFLKELEFQAPLGVYAVGGNTDVEGWQAIFDPKHVTVIDSTRTIDCPRDDLCLTGLSVEDSRDTQLRIEGSQRYHICLGHYPDFSLGQIQADLLIAGHTHGGQVQLPFLGPIMKLSRVPRSWAAGLTELTNNRHLLVSRGIGMERGSAPRLRFLCRPELVVLDIRPSE